ncbi:NitT/TauT family transport system substrate-binding protein [Sedimentibacter acidaminivorans]|jgi:NitT/TauT family transport system substrate-binding protein|uniref:NitT/TauT family transport system substrate-binding protein n=1 Tax=Sedimentibacter acidaminivorans TaxID=913099 RepID=A0ABS4GDV8_9FIRM|nr:ABC transporter substrate-binding protein [Sedimentibacter acidaminivorans]MBP1925896.1 NitT/TauT family transport system substrate-binding protein [Sedimentibacter acidaminivorans]
MKKFISLLLVVVLVASLLLVGCEKQKEKQNVRLVEVTHSVFYSPQYVAIEKGFFEKYNINIELTNGGGADKCMSAVLSNQADIGFMGPEASVYVFKQGREDYVINFAQLTQRDGSFIVGREDDDNFTIEKMKGKTILGGRKGGMPLMTLEYVLKQHGLIPGVDVDVRTDIQFDMMAGAFASGQADFTTLFEPVASTFELEGKGYVVGSLGVEAGYIPYTCYSTTKSFIEKNPELIQNFTNAIYEGMVWVQEHTAQEIAETILPQFPDSDVEFLASVVQRYKDQDTWKPDLVLKEDGYNRMIDIIKTAGELDEGAPYEKVVTTEFAIKAMETVK